MDAEAASYDMDSLLRVAAEVVRGPAAEAPVEPSDDEVPILWFAVGEPPVVLVGFDGDTVRVARPAVRWESQRPVLVASRTEECRTGPGIDLRAWFTAAVKRARTARLSRFRTCRECGRRTPPEWLHSATLCSGCAERNHGVVY